MRPSSVGGRLPGLGYRGEEVTSGSHGATIVPQNFERDQHMGSFSWNRVATCSNAMGRPLGVSQATKNRCYQTSNQRGHRHIGCPTIDDAKSVCSTMKNDLITYVIALGDGKNNAEGNPRNVRLLSIVYHDRNGGERTQNHLVTYPLWLRSAFRAPNIQRQRRSRLPDRTLNRFAGTPTLNCMCIWDFLYEGIISWILRAFRPGYYFRW